MNGAILPVHVPVDIPRQNVPSKNYPKIALWSVSFAALILLAGSLIYLGNRYYNSKIIPYALPAALIIIPGLFILTIYKMDRYIMKHPEKVKNLL